MKGSNKKYVILPIQYLRAIAAIMVVWIHSMSQVAGTFDVFPPIISGFGKSGVDIFFIISGFIMRVAIETQPLSPGQFLVRRVQRIAPLYWISTTALVVAALIAPSFFRTTIVEPSTFVMSLLFIPHMSLSFPEFAWPVLVPGWTLNFEVFFYILFALSLYLPKAIRDWSLIVALIGLGLIGELFGPFTGPMAMTYTSPLLAEFGAGALIAKLYIDGSLVLSRSMTYSCLAIGIAMHVVPECQDILFYSFTGSVLLVVAAVQPCLPNISNKLMLKIGDASYSIYLTHLFTLGALRFVWIKVFPQPATFTSAVLFLAASLVVCLSFGHVYFKAVEAPIFQWLVRRSKKKAAAQAAADAAGLSSSGAGPSLVNMPSVQSEKPV